MSAKLFAFLFFLFLAMLPSTTQAAPVSSTSVSSAPTSSAPTASANNVNGNYIYPYPSSLINQMAEQNFADPHTVFGPAFSQLLNTTSGTGQGNETYQGISQFWHDDLLGNFFANISQIISNWLNHFFSGYLPDMISSLSGVVKSFFLNPNLAQITTSSSNSGDLSFLLSQLVNIIYGIALDLLFVLFIIAIWQYWTKASWQGNISAMSAVGRLICTIGIVLSWPTIYSFEIELSNEMINAIFVNSNDQLHLFDMVMANMFKVSLYAGAGNVITQIIPAANLATLGIASLGGFLSTVALLALCILAIVLIYELIYLIVLKAIQMALLTAQYVFAPVFLIFFATPSTERIATGYIRTFAETSVWSFIWIGLLKILVILIYANFNPWGKIITTIGILQLMMRVPEFLGRFKISAASEFISPAFLTTHLRKNAAEYAEKVGGYKDQFVSAFTSLFRGASVNASASQASNGAGNNTSADFSFGNAGGNVVQLPSLNKRQVDYNNNKSGYSSSKDQNTSATDTNLSTNVVNTHAGDKNIDMEQTANTPTINDEKKEGTEPKPIKTHADFSVPGRRNLPRKGNIFGRHNKTVNNGGGGKIGDGGNIIDLPARKPAPYGVPATAAALLDSNSLPAFNPSGSDSASLNPSNFNPSSVNPSSFDPSSFSRSGFSSFWGARLPSVALSKFDLPTDRLNLAADKTNVSARRLLAVRLAAEQLAHGSGSALMNRQQFALPDFARLSKTGSQSGIDPIQLKETHQTNGQNEQAQYDWRSRNSYQPHYDTGNGNKPGQSNKTDGDFKTNRRHVLAENNTASQGRLLSNDGQFKSDNIPQGKIGRSANNQNNRYSHSNRNEQRNQYINQHKTALYYSPLIYPGWQRSYYANSRVALPVTTERSSSFYADTNHPASPYFRSYYS